MKKIICAIAFAILTFTLSAKTLVTNNDTGMKLTEDLGVYSISGSQGVLILGNIKESRDLLWKMEKCFMAANVDSILNITINDKKYEVRSDDQGLYIIKVGLGAVKLRHSDVSKFWAYLQAVIAKDKINRIGKIITE